MLRRLVFALALVALGVTVALAAPIVGKVQSTAADTVVLVVKIAKDKVPDWYKEGTKVKIDGGKGVIIAVGDTTVTVVTPKAKEMKKDAEVPFEKAKAALTGC
jgi:hypothetical protein